MKDGWTNISPSGLYFVFFCFFFQARLFSAKRRVGDHTEGSILRVHTPEYENRVSRYTNRRSPPAEADALLSH